MNREICAFWVLSHTVSRPSAHRAAAARPSSGAGASRWFSIVWLITTSQPSKADRSAGGPELTATFESVPGNSSAGGSSAPAKPTTAGSGS